MERVPARLARDRLDDVRVDLRQRVVAGEAAERVRQRRVAARVVERVAGLVQERLVVVQPTLRARDQVDDLRRIGRDHAGARRLLRPVVEVGPDVRVGGEVEAERLQRLEADVGRALLACRSTRAARAGGRRTCGTTAAGRRAPARARARTTSRAGAGMPRPLPRPARPSASASGRSEIPFSSSLRATGSGSCESSAESSSAARSSSSRSSLKTSFASAWSTPSSSRSR